MSCNVCGDANWTSANAHLQTRQHTNLLAPSLALFFDTLVSPVTCLWYTVLHARLQPNFPGLEVVQVYIPEDTGLRSKAIAEQKHRATNCETPVYGPMTFL